MLKNEPIRPCSGKKTAGVFCSPKKNLLVSSASAGSFDRVSELRGEGESTQGRGTRNTPHESVLGAQGRVLEISGRS